MENVRKFWWCVRLEDLLLDETSVFPLEKPLRGSRHAADGRCRVRARGPRFC